MTTHLAHVNLMMWGCIFEKKKSWRCINEEIFFPQWYISGKIFVIVDVSVRKIIFLDDISTTKKFPQQCIRGEKYFLQ